MTAPLDEKAIAQAHEAYAKTTGGLLEGIPMANAIRAYLSAVALSDELPVWGYHVRRLTDEGAKFSQSLRFNQEQASPTNVVTPLVSGPEARSAIAALRAERDAAFTMSKCECGPDEACRNLVAASTHAETAEAEVKRLTEEKEALRKALGNMRCPRPCNHRPDEFDAKDCVAAGECGCGAHVLGALNSREKADG